MFGSGSWWQCCLEMFNDGMKRSIMALNWIFDWRVRNKENSISYSNVSCVWTYGKLRLIAWHKAINNIKILSGGSPIKERQSGTFLPPCLRCIMQGHSFWLAVQLNMGLGVWFLYPTLRWLRAGTIGPAFLLAGQSEPCIQGCRPP